VLLEPHVKEAELPASFPLLHRGERIATLFMPYSGIVSLVVRMSGGELVEAGMIGRNSVVGAAGPLEAGPALADAIVRVPARGVLVDAAAMREVALQVPGVSELLIRHARAVTAYALQVAACNASHGLEQRLARWLLSSRDLLDADALPLTQERLSEMLGVKRTTVTAAIKHFQDAGLIHCRRGQIAVPAAGAIGQRTCECYGAIQEQLARLTDWRPTLGAEKIPATRPVQYASAT
jgi:CRP-like cAMP-binding protein